MVWKIYQQHKSTIFDLGKLGFREGSITSVYDASRSGRPLSSTSTPSIDTIKNLMKLTSNYPSQSAGHLAEHLNVVKETVPMILHQQLFIENFVQFRCFVFSLIATKSKESATNITSSLTRPHWKMTHRVPHIHPVYHIGPISGQYVIFQCAEKQKRN